MNKKAALKNYLYALYELNYKFKGLHVALLASAGKTTTATKCGNLHNSL